MKAMKQLLTLTVMLLTAAALYACGGDDDGGNSPAVTLTVPTKQHTYAASGGTWDFVVQASQKPAIASSASWLTVSEQTSTSATVFKYTATAKEMTETDDRTATITVSAGSLKETISVTQTAIDGLVISSPRLEAFEAQGGSLTVVIKANGSYTVNVSNDWITRTTTRATMQDYTETFTIAPNAGAARQGRVSFSLGSITESVAIQQSAGTSAQGEIEGNARDIAKLMYPGWNLGNTMEGGSNSSNWKNVGIATETSWQSTKTTQQIIDFVKSQGFKSVRIPTAWVMGHITEESTVSIDEEWMARVKEIVDYCVADGLYVLLNDHWDGGWLENSFGDLSASTVAANNEKLRLLWTQIATTFRDYDEHLLFGGLNEPAADSQAKTDALLKYEQVFIDAVRATGGNNAKRTLVVQGPTTDIDNTDKFFDVTKLSDPAGDGYLMVEVHYYNPPQFSGVWENNQPVWFWGAANHVSGDSHNATWAEEDYVKTQFQKMKTKFSAKGYPIILGEFGANWRKLSAHQAEHDASIKLFHEVVTREAVNCGMVPMVWDINATNQNGTNGIMTIIDRSGLKVFGTPAMEGIKAGTAAAQWPAN